MSKIGVFAQLAAQHSRCLSPRPTRLRGDLSAARSAVVPTVCLLSTLSFLSLGAAVSSLLLLIVACPYSQCALFQLHTLLLSARFTLHLQIPTAGNSIGHSVVAFVQYLLSLQVLCKEILSENEYMTLQELGAHC